MKTIDSLSELNMPVKHRNFLQKYLGNLSKIDIIDRIILFGSCAKGYIHEHSDIDLMIIGNGITRDDETNIYGYSLPDVPYKEYVSTDVIICSQETYDEYKTQYGYVQRHVEKDGIELTNYLNSMKGVIVS